MAMTMTGEVQLPASREVVWAKLNDRSLNSDGEPQAVAESRAGSGKLYLYSSGRGIFPVQDVAGMWLKYGAKP